MFYHKGPITFHTSIRERDWDGGGMNCSEPVGRRITLTIGNLSFEIFWKYTEKQLDKLYITNPDLWYNSYRRTK